MHGGRIEAGEDVELVVGSREPSSTGDGLVEFSCRQRRREDERGV